MTIDRVVFAVAGSFILISLLLAHYHSEYWLWFTAFVGANLLQSAFTSLSDGSNIKNWVLPERILIAQNWRQP
jgi:hypothetical protein